MTYQLPLLLLIALLAVPFPVTAGQTLPANGPITSRSGWRIDPFGSGNYHFHRGIDIAVPIGTTVRATHQGKVVHAGPYGGYGNAVIIRQQNGVGTLYGHNSKLMVKVGEWIDTGAVIALSGNTGRSTGPHVHYEVLQNDRSDAFSQVASQELKPALPRQSTLNKAVEQQLEVVCKSILEKIYTPL